MIRFFAALVLCLLALSRMGHAQAVTIEDICLQPWGGGQPPVGQIEAVEFQHVGVTRYYCVYVPTNFGALAAPNRVLFAFHGGAGNASVLMQGNKALIEQAEANDYLAVFAHGMPLSAICATDLSLRNGWTDADCAVSGNVDYTRAMIAKVMADYPDVEQDQVFLVGFSGGAKHIYRVVAQWTDADPKIAAFATMAGALVKLTFKDVQPAFSHVPILEGAPVPAILFHGSRDDRMNQDGGISPRRQEITGSFSMKVQTVVALNTGRDAGGALIVSGGGKLSVNPAPSAYAPLPQTPNSVSGQIWSVVPGNTPQVADTVAMIGANTPHSWRRWMSSETLRFFNGQ